MILHPNKTEMEAHRSAIDSEESRSVFSGRPEPQETPSQGGENASEHAAEKKAAACFICYEGIPSVLIDPCCHCELCKECMNQLITQRQESCPICKTVISDFTVESNFVQSVRDRQPVPDQDF